MLEITVKQTVHQKSHETAGKGIVPVDAHFNVKGVGVVVLGSVAQGMIKKHETLKVLPTEKTAQIRSIQKHDDDAESAIAGDRVGLALKNIESEDLDRGFVLTSDPAVKYATTVSGKAQLVKYWPAPLKEGMVLYAGNWMQFLPTRLEKTVVDGDWRMPVLTLSMEKAHAAADEICKLGTHNGKQCIGRFLLNRWWLFHLWSEVGIIHVEGNLAVPGGIQRCRFVISHLANARVEEYK